MRSFLPQLFPPQKKHLFHERFQKSKKNNWFLGGWSPTTAISAASLSTTKKQKREATDRWSPFWRDHFLKKLSSSNPSIFRCCIIVLGISVITLPPPHPSQPKKNIPAQSTPQFLKKKPNLHHFCPPYQRCNPPDRPAIPGQVGDLRWDLLLFAPGAVEGLLEPVKAVPNQEFVWLKEDS